MNPIEPTEATTFTLYGLTAFDVQYWNGSAWATVPGGSVTGNNKVWRKITFAPITTTKIRVLTAASPDGYSRLTELEAWGPGAPPRTNVALKSNGGVASASSTYTPSQGAGYDANPGGANNGNRSGKVGANSTAWTDNTQNAWTDWLQIEFNGSKTIDEIDVFTLQDNYMNPIEPTEATTFSVYGLTAFDVQYWNGSAWVTVPGGSVTGNNKVWEKITFAAITTTKIRVLTNASPDGYSRVTELEAWTAASGGGAAQIRWLVADQLGTPRMIFDQTGSLANVSRHDYLPFGEELYAGTGGRTTAQGYGGDNVRQKFTSKERDIETGLDYFLARYYSSSQGRFTSIDPENHQAMLDMSQPQSWNAYSYVNNNPLAYVDPDGMGAWTRLKNLFFYGYAVENDEIARMEQERRAWLSQHIYERDKQGNWRPFDASQLTTQEVFDTYREVKFRNENGDLQRLTDQEMADAWNRASTITVTTRGPSGRESTGKYLEKHWDKGNHGSIKKSIEYHLAKHGKRMSEVEYTQRAVRAFKDSTAMRTAAKDMQGRAAVKVVSKEGTGLFTKSGKIIWFQPK